METKIALLVHEMPINFTINFTINFLDTGRRIFIFKLFSQLLCNGVITDYHIIKIEISN